LPNWQALHDAPQNQVLKLWQGLGYNRRALWAKDAAKKVTLEHKGMLPNSAKALQTFKGIGPNTAGSVIVFAYNTPEVFIETNIRRVFIHHFFAGRKNIDDSEILELVGSSLDKQDPRKWYWALMDYGSVLSKQVPNPNRRSKQHTIQPKFAGSLRQIRGQVLKTLLDSPRSIKELQAEIADPRLQKVLDTLTKEGFVQKTGSKFSIGDKT
jgi:A/G-specific adenine glycosylase